MFASLKNKIREETGSDLSKLTAKITSSTVQKIESLRGKSHQGSTSSLNSIVSSDSVKEDGPIEPEEFRKRLSKIETEFARKLEQKEHEWRDIVNEKDKQLQTLEKEKDEAYRQISNLKDSLKIAEEFKQKIIEHQENNEQIETLQSQELSKVKHLVLLREQELAEKTTALKDANVQLDKLRNEVSRLRRQEELLSDVQDDLESLRHSSSRDLAHLATQLAKSEQERKYLSDLVVILRQSANESTPDEKTASERKLLEQRLEEAHLHLADIKTSWSDKIASLETQDNTKTELKVVRKNLDNTESELDKSADERSKLKLSVDSEHSTNASLRQIVTKLEKELGEEKSNSLNVQKTLTRVTSEKNTALLRNAEISQQMEMVKQDMRRQERDMNDLLNKLTQLEDENSKLKESTLVEQKLRNSIAELEDQISEKNKSIKMLQLRLADMKKTLQQELRTPGNPNYHSDLLENSTAAILTPTQISTKNFPSVVRRDDDDVNFKYLKHVVIKFLTSREYEAQHLIKAISTLLKFTPEEEKLIQDTIEWRKSWFGSKPKYPAGQKPKSYPHS